MRISEYVARFVHKVPVEFTKSYHRYLQRLFVRRLRILYYFSMTLIPGAFVFDILIFPDSWKVLFKVRILCALVCLFLFFLSSRTRLRNYPSQMCQVLIFVGAVTIGILTHLTGAYQSPYYAGQILIFIGIATVAPWGFDRALLATGFGIITIHLSLNLLPSLLAHEVIIWPLVWNSIYFLVFTFILVYIASGIFENTRRQIFVTTMQEKIRSRKLRDSKNKIDSLLKNRSRFISNITHELKTPLSIVIGNTELFMEKINSLDASLADQLQVVQRAAFQLSMHVDRIIAVSSADDPDQQLVTENYDYIGIARHIFSLFKARARDGNISFTIKAPPGPLVVNVDIIRTEEILNNLIQNAFKFVEPGDSITVSISSDGHEVFTEVTDTGCGIPDDQLNKVFGRLYQADNVLSKNHGGLGVGLFLCKHNVELHHGKIGVHSKLGKGTSFRFSLPLYIDQAAPVKNQPQEITEDRRGIVPQRRTMPDRRFAERAKKFEYQQNLGLDSLAKMAFIDNIDDYENRNPSLPSVLIVEDNGGMMKVIIDALGEEYNLFLATNGHEALDKLETNAGQISLILSDVMMPGMSGFDFCARVMDKEEWQHIPLIFVTALLSEEDQLKGFSLGATDYIVKPYNIKILKEKIAHWISRRQYEMLIRNISSSLEQRVQEAARLKDIVLHEITNPLQLISMANYRLQKQKELLARNNPEQRETIEKNVEMLEHGLQAMYSVMDVARNLEGLQMSSRRPEPMISLFDDAVTQSSGFLKDVKLEVVIDEALAGASIYCEKKMLTQVFVNLLRNSTEAIRERVALDQGVIRITAAPGEKNRVHIMIQDNGAGIPADVIKMLFRFKYTTKKDGTGIGLHFSKMLLKLHEGYIRAESLEGIGTVIHIELPLQIKEKNKGLTHTS
ncbi:MAG: ATP-binding protein [Desulfobacterales bacterium]|nr:ATP-binding protein [Desulfobacterales bacterium]